MALIEIKHAIKTYVTGEDSFNALDDVSLSVDEGEFVAIMGASGSGKSTCMNMLGTLDKPNSGTYFLDGIDVLKLSSEKLSEIRNVKLGFVFQGFNLISRTTALENVELPMIYKGIPAEERKKRAREMLKVVGLEHREDHMPNQMSGGQQQRVAIARAIAQAPPILLADEPTGNLDSGSSKEIINIIKRLYSEGRTVIIITHDPGIAKQAKRIITISDGQIVSDIMNPDYKEVES